MNEKAENTAPAAGTPPFDMPANAPEAAAPAGPGAEENMAAPQFEAGLPHTFQGGAILESAGADFAEREQGAGENALRAMPAVREFEEFISRFPDVSAEDIPESVWAEVKAGRTLTSAYAMYENSRLRGEIAALKAKQSARERALPGSATAGGGRARDPFLEGFME